MHLDPPMRTTQLLMTKIITRCLTAAVVPLFAGFLFAQTEQTTQTTTTTTTNLNGTLIDAGCYNQHTETTEHSASNPDENTTRTKTTKTTTDKVQCPVTTTTTTFGLLTPEGQVVRFDEPSNTKIVEIVKGNKRWSQYMTAGQPIKVKVHGAKHGDVYVLESMQ